MLSVAPRHSFISPFSLKVKSDRLSGENATFVTLALSGKASVNCEFDVL